MRFGTLAVPARPFRQPVWRGEALEGRTLLVHAEQGLGDTIQFCRYIPELARRLAGDGRLVFEVQRPLARLMAGLPEPPPIVRAGDPMPPFDLVCPLLSLPERFATTAATAPRRVPYLAGEPDRIAHWRARLGPHGVRIGIAWRGNPKSQAELGRSIPLAHFLPLGRLPGVRLISLQRDHGLDEIAALPSGSRVETPGEGFDAGPDAFLDTAAIMPSLDLIITSDTNIAHLAGALARPVWVALQHVPDWRWMFFPPDGAASDSAGSAEASPQGFAHLSPWYPTMRLFRQVRRGDWAGVFAEIATALAERIAAGPASEGAPT